MLDVTATAVKVFISRFLVDLMLFNHGSFTADAVGSLAVTYYKFTAKAHDESNLKIDQHLMKLR